MPLQALHSAPGLSGEGVPVSDAFNPERVLAWLTGGLDTNNTEALVDGLDDLGPVRLDQSNEGAYVTVDPALDSID